MWTTLGTLSDTVMYLYGSDSQTDLIAVNDDQGGSGAARLASRIERRLDPAVYYIKVTGYGTRTGSFTLHLSGP